MGIIKKKIVLGGEHYFSPTFFFNKNHHFIDNLIDEFKNDFFINFTFGGYYSILAILDDIKSKTESDFTVLLPSYLCPSILKPFKIKGVIYKFYRVDGDLFIDTKHLLSQIDDNVKAVFFIDYFGASQLDRLYEVVNLLRNKNISIIQDVVQCLKIEKDKLFGDYIFNSFRKFFPFEGSILLSKQKMDIKFFSYSKKYIILKRFGQFLRYLHIEYNLLSSNPFLKLLEKAEQNYYNDKVLRMPKFNFKQFNKFNISEIVKNQKHYYNELFKKFENLVPRLLRRDDFVPLGFVVKLDNRDTLKSELAKNNIFCPVHWNLLNQINEADFSESISTSNQIITIPIIPLNQNKLQFLLQIIKRIFRNESIS